MKILSQYIVRKNDSKVILKTLKLDSSGCSIQLDIKGFLISS